MNLPKITTVRVLLVVLGISLVSSAFFYRVGRKPIRKEINVEYAIGDSAFRESLDGLLGTPLVKSNEVQTLINGDEIFPAMLEAIGSAKKTITFETYIWSKGKICDDFKKALCEKSKSGVNVHVIVDGMGSFKLRQADINEMRASDVKIVKFNRDQWYKVNVQFNHRTHRKILVIDGKIGFIGGSCLHDSWLGNAETEEQWRDTHFMIEGPAVAQLQGIFADNWRQTTGQVLHGPDYFPQLEPAGKFAVQCYMSGPKDNQEHIRLAILYSLSSAKKSIRIAHAYFVPDELMRKTLLSACKRGVEVEIIVPTKTDSKMVKAASRAHWVELMEGGVKFYEYGPAMYHVKEIIIDDRLVIAGSANFDNRSFRINDEANINILDTAFAAREINIFEKDKAQSRPLSETDLKNRPMYTKVADHFARLFSSQF